MLNRRAFPWGQSRRRCSQAIRVSAPSAAVISKFIEPDPMLTTVLAALRPQPLFTGAIYLGVAHREQRRGRGWSRWRNAAFASGVEARPRYRCSCASMCECTRGKRVRLTRSSVPAAIRRSGPAA